MAPKRVKRDSRHWLVSVGPDGDVIATTAARSLLLRGRAAAYALEHERPDEASVTEVADQLCFVWDNKPIIVSDEPEMREALIWDNASTLRAILSDQNEHVYLYCSRLPGEAMALFASWHPSVAVTPILRYGQLWTVGPICRLEGGPCLRCWASLLRANLPSLDRRVRDGHKLCVGEDAMSGSLVVQLMRVLWEAPLPVKPLDYALIFDRDSGEVRRSRVLPLPGCVCGGSRQLGSLDDLEDQLFGLVNRVGEPNRTRAPLAIATAMSRSHPNASGGGCSVDPVVARRKALAESAERLAAGRLPSGVVLGKPDAMLEAPVTLSSLLPYTGQQYDKPDFPYSRLHIDDIVEWLPVYNWAYRPAGYLPARLLTIADALVGPPFAPQTSTGIAAGPSFPMARDSAFLEIVERDCATRSWFDGSVLRLDPQIWVPFLFERLHSHGIGLDLGLCEAPGGVAVLLSFVFQQTSGLGAYGSAAGLSPASAAVHAVEEAVQTMGHREPDGRLLRRDDVSWNGFERGDVAVGGSHGINAELLAHYRPLTMDLTSAETRAVGLCVASVWSPAAVDFPGASQPLPLARWQPSKAARRRLSENPDIF